MASSITITTSINADGLAMSGSATQESSGTLSHNDTLANAGDAGTLQIPGSSSGESSGTIDLASGHGITTAHTVDVYWTGGVRYGMTVDSNAATSITVSGGSGDVLPEDDEAVVVGVTEDITFEVDATNLKALAASCNKRCFLDFRTSVASVMTLELAENGIWSWTYDSGTTNPLGTSEITTIRASCGSTAAGLLKVKALYDSTP